MADVTGMRTDEGGSHVGNGDINDKDNEIDAVDRYSADGDM